MDNLMSDNVPEYEDPEPRLPRGYLALDADLICKAFDNGEITLSEGKYMTPYMVGTLLIEETDGARKRPSSGAISAVFKRWEKAGYAEFRQNPYAFTKLTMQGKLMGSWKVFQEVEDEAAKSN